MASRTPAVPVPRMPAGRAPEASPGPLGSGGAMLFSSCAIVAANSGFGSASAGGFRGARSRSALVADLSVGGTCGTGVGGGAGTCAGTWTAIRR